MLQLTNIITLTRHDFVWLKLGMTHSAGPGLAQLNPNQMASRVVIVIIVSYCYDICKLECLISESDLNVYKLYKYNIVIS